MYAILQNGGKQYKVSEGQIISLEKLNNSIGEIVNFNQILMTVDGKNVKIGTPTLKNIVIQAKVINHDRNSKIKIIKFRRRKHSRKHSGHRQWFTNVKIVDIITY